MPCDHLSLKENHNQATRRALPSQNEESNAATYQVNFERLVQTPTNQPQNVQSIMPSGKSS